MPRHKGHRRLGSGQCVSSQCFRQAFPWWLSKASMRLTELLALYTQSCLSFLLLSRKVQVWSLKHFIVGMMYS